MSGEEETLAEMMADTWKLLHKALHDMFTYAKEAETPDVRHERMKEIFAICSPLIYGDGAYSTSINEEWDTLEELHYYRDGLDPRSPNSPCPPEERERP